MPEMEVLDRIEINVKSHRLLKKLLQQNLTLEEIGEDTSEYESLWGDSLGVTEPRVPVFDYWAGAGGCWPRGKPV